MNCKVLVININGEYLKHLWSVAESSDKLQEMLNDMNVQHDTLKMIINIEDEKVEVKE